MLLRGACHVQNNTVVNSETGIYANGNEATITAVNNILIQTAHDAGYGLYIGTAGGCYSKNDHNCIYALDGQAMDSVCGTGRSGGIVPVTGVNTLQVDPELTSDYRSLNFNVMRGGKPDVYGNPGQIGAVLGKYTVESRAAASNQGRMRIFR